VKDAGRLLPRGRNRTDVTQLTKRKKKEAKKKEKLHTAAVVRPGKKSMISQVGPVCLPMWVHFSRRLPTQQPGAIADQIISQGDNFFVLHLLNDADLATLKRHNAYFADDILGVIRSEPIPGNCYFWSAPDQPFVLPVRVREFGKGATTGATSVKRTSTKAGRTKVQGSDIALEPLVLGVLGGHPGVWLYPVAARDGKPTSPPGEIAFAFDYLMSGVASRVRESAVPIPAEDPAAWLHQELPAKIEQVLAALGGRPGYAVLASATRKVWVLPARAIPLSAGKQLRGESVDVRRSI
jgi:hypothetical protein